MAPAIVGPVSTGSQTDYEALAEAAIHTIDLGGQDMRAFVGPRDDGFFFDIMGAFDLLNIRDPGADTFSGFNVYSIALEIPKSRFSDVVGDADPDPEVDILLSLSADRSDSMPLHGATVSGDIFVYTDTDDSVNSVSFYIDDDLIRTERVTPHDLAGTEIGSGSGLDRDARPFDTTDLTDGVRTLRVEVDEGEVAAGDQIR